MDRARNHGDNRFLESRVVVIRLYDEHGARLDARAADEAGLGQAQRRHVSLSWPTCVVIVVDIHSRIIPTGSLARFSQQTELLLTAQWDIFK